MLFEQVEFFSHSLVGTYLFLYLQLAVGRS